MKKSGFEGRGARRARGSYAGLALSLLTCAVVVGCSGAPDAPAPAQTDPAANALLLKLKPAARPSATPTANWQASVGARITAGEYKIRSEGNGLSAFNRAQSMRARWTGGGLELRSDHASAETDPANLNARLQALRAGASHPTAGAAAASGNADDPGPALTMRTVGLARAEQRIAAEGSQFSSGSCRKDNEVDEYGECLKRAESAQPAWREWWENRPDGLEQGFDVPARPLVEPSGAPLRIEMALDGASAAISDDGQAAVLITTSGQTLRYGQLAARDAAGNALPIRLTGRDGGLALEVDDSAAAYPIAIDPVMTSTWDGEGTQSNAAYGTSVASAGDVNGDGFSDVIVGAPYYTGINNSEGTAFLYLGSSNGLPNAAVNWGVLGGKASANLGVSVAAAGDVNGDGYGDILVGGTGWGSAAGGGVLLFYGNKNGLPNKSPDWSTSGGAGDSLGNSVASAGDVNGDGYGDFIAGAPFVPPGGVAYIWYGSATGPGSTRTTISTSIASAALGYSVAGAGDVNGDGLSDVIVGAPLYEVSGNFVGYIGVYHGATGGISSNSAANFSASGPASSFFGYSVASAGDVNADGYSDVIVGSPNYSNPESQEGRFQVYYGGSNGIAGTPWSVESNSTGAELGHSVASAGDINADGYGDIIVGAPFATYSTTNEGTATIYFGTSGRSLVEANGVLNGGQSNMEFGDSVACAGDVDGDGHSDVIVGAPYYSGAYTQSGRAFLYTGNGPASYASPGQPQITGTQANAELNAVAGAGDVNGDGYGDVIVVSQSDNGDPILNEGVAKVYLGGPGGTGTSAIWTAGSGVQNVAGFTAMSAGDVNGDGYDDIVTCSEISSTSTGFARLYEGYANGVYTASSWHVAGPSGSDFGYRCAGVGDINGDGYGDVVVSAPFYTNGQKTAEGALYVYLGGANGLSTTPKVIESNVTTAELGTSLASAGDVNHDGYADVIVGAPNYTNGQTNEGEVLVYLGGASGLGTPWQLESNTASALFGYSVAGAGDVNGDGYDDIIVGAPNYSSGNGAASLYYGSANGPVLGSDVFNAAWTFQGFSGGFFGISVASGGDMNGDGYADLLVGAPYYPSNSGGADGGVVVGFNGGASGVGGIDLFQVGASGSYQGYCVANSGDVNGDGYSDAIAAAVLYSGSYSNEGAASIYFGSGFDTSASGFGIRPQTRRLNTTTPIATGDKSFNSTGFDAVLRNVRPPTGRTRVKLQVEAKPFNVAFNGTTDVVTGAWTATSIGTTTLTQNVTAAIFSNPAIGTLPHWRARLIYDPSRLPWFGRSRWYYGGDIGRPQDVVARIAP